MPRTAGRPLPTGRLRDREVACYAVAATVFGLVYLATTVNWSITLLAALSWLVYVWVYTPLKVFTAWQTPIGAVPGAMPARISPVSGSYTNPHTVHKYFFMVLSSAARAGPPAGGTVML